MVYIEPVHLGWEPLVESWAENFADYNKQWAELVKPIVMDLCTQVIPYMRENCKEPGGLETLVISAYFVMRFAFTLQPRLYTLWGTVRPAPLVGRGVILSV